MLTESSILKKCTVSGGFKCLLFTLLFFVFCFDWNSAYRTICSTYRLTLNKVQVNVRLNIVTLLCSLISDYICDKLSGYLQKFCGCLIMISSGLFRE